MTNSLARGAGNTSLEIIIRLTRSLARSNNHAPDVNSYSISWKMTWLLKLGGLYTYREVAEICGGQDSEGYLAVLHLFSLSLSLSLLQKMLKTHDFHSSIQPLSVPGLDYTWTEISGIEFGFVNSSHSYICIHQRIIHCYLFCFFI